MNTTDNFAFASAFNNPNDYLAFLDFEGNGFINTTDNFQFRSRFNRPMAWTV